MFNNSQFLSCKPLVLSQVKHCWERLRTLGNIFGFMESREGSSNIIALQQELRLLNFCEQRIQPLSGLFVMQQDSLCQSQLSLLGEHIWFFKVCGPANNWIGRAFSKSLGWKEGFSNDFLPLLVWFDFQGYMCLHCRNPCSLCSCCISLLGIPDCQRKVYLGAQGQIGH